MGSKKYPLQDVGIYHNLPQFDPAIKDLKAIVTGANGISGFHTMRVLLESPQRWSKIYALSRKPPPKEMMALLTADQRSRVQHVAVDFLSSTKDIAEAMSSASVSADHIFFYSYLQPKPKPGQRAWSNAEELVKVNKALLENFLQALDQANVTPKRFLLQTGAKNYGVHIGRHRTPACESDPQPKHLEPNFYYPQEELLFKYCEAHPGTAWNLIHPAWIVGAVTTAQINGFHPFAVYSAVQARKGEPVSFPGDWASWQFEAHPATARLTGYLSEWAVLEESCANERFNAQDTSPMSWDRFFHEVARWYGVEKVVPPPEDDGKYTTLTGSSGKATPMGYGPPKVMKFSFSLVAWAKQPENQKIWKDIMEKSNGKVIQNPFDDPDENFIMGDAILGTMGTMNMNKARRMGWTGYVDCIESIFEMYQENAKLGLVPEMVVEAPRPLV